MNPRSNRTYSVCRAICAAFLRAGFRLRVRGLEHVPAEGGCLLAANHASFLDPPVLGVAAGARPVRFLARASLLEFPVFRWLLPRLEVIPIEPGRGDVAALRATLRALQRGGLVAIFPEGTRSDDGLLLPPRGGIGFLIAKAGVPVVPAFLDGTFRAWPRKRRVPRPARISVAFGPPIRPEEIAAEGAGREAFERLARQIMARIAALAGPEPAP